MRGFYARHAPTLHYFLVGGWNTICGYLIFLAVYYGTAGLRLHYLFVLLISHMLSVTSAYIMYRKFVFKSSGAVFRECLRFCSFYWIPFLGNLCVLPMLVEWFEMNPALSQGMFTLVMALGGYVWHTTYTFRIGNKERVKVSFSDNHPSSASDRFSASTQSK